MKPLTTTSDFLGNGRKESQDLEMMVTFYLMIIFICYNYIQASVNRDDGDSSYKSTVWRKYISDEYIEGNSEKQGGLNKIVETGESKFVKRKYTVGSFYEDNGCSAEWSEGRVDILFSRFPI